MRLTMLAILFLGFVAEGTFLFDSESAAWDAEVELGGVTCQELSNYYGVDAGKTWGCAPKEAQTWWKKQSCNTRPQTSTNNGCTALHKCDPNHPFQEGIESGCCGKYGPCPAYIGDCNNDSQCEGDLKCNIANKGNTFGYSNNYVDVCGYDPSIHKCHPNHPDQEGTKSGCCGKYGPCPAYIGDCNTHSQCEGDLLCNIQDKGNTYGYSNNAVDVCGPKPKPDLNVRSEAEIGAAKFTWKRFGPCTVGSRIKQINLPMREAMRTLITNAKAECERLSNCVGFEAIQDGKKKQANLMSSGTFKNPPHAPETKWCWQKIDATPHCTSAQATEPCLCGPKGRITCKTGLYCHGFDNKYKSQCKSHPDYPVCGNNGSVKTKANCLCGANKTTCGKGNYCYDNMCANKAKPPPTPHCTSAQATEPCLCGVKGLITCKTGLYCHGFDSEYRSDCKKHPDYPDCGNSGSVKTKEYCLCGANKTTCGKGKYCYDNKCTNKAKPAPKPQPTDKNTWYMLRHKTGSPVRCASTPGMIECASKNGKNCFWNKYPKQEPYTVMTGVKNAKKPYAIQCPGWKPDDGSDACEALGCYASLHKCHPNHPGQEGIKSGCCGKYGPCPLHIGDCNNHSDCEGDLECNIADKGTEFGYSNKYVDVCGPKKEVVKPAPKPVNRNVRAEAEIGGEGQLVGGFNYMLFFAFLLASAVFGFYIGQRKSRKENNYKILEDGVKENGPETEMTYQTL